MFVSTEICNCCNNNCKFSFTPWIQCTVCNKILCRDCFLRFSCENRIQQCKTDYSKRTCIYCEKICFENPL